ncbi:MAG TPA: alpha-L-arabinofuranosidase C-terminal domain-containing protein, partial [Phycisphaerae bacterium]|nr:alpha-L-arabinofuranosidase C-terminal domain-containing protein [Phycisphaerae bacterium]
NVSPQPRAIDLTLEGAGTVQKTASIETLAGDPASVNTIAEPEKVVPKKINIENAGAKFTHEFAAHSVNIVRLTTK